ncbi:MAG: CBS domain-containing protein [Fidelibacterota bacterium]
MEKLQVPKIKDYMTTSIVKLSANMDIYESIDLLLKYKISGAPVENESGHLIGVLSERDCLRVMANGSFHDLPGAVVSDYMSKKIFTLQMDNDIFQAADTFLHHKFRRIPIVDKKNRLVGQISRRDVLRAIQDAAKSSKIEKYPSKYLSPEMKASLGDKSS